MLITGTLLPTEVSAIKKCTEILQPLNDLMKGYKKSLRNKIKNWERNNDVFKTFAQPKHNLAGVTLLHYPMRNGTI